MSAVAQLGVWASPFLAVALAAAFHALTRSDELQDIVSFSSRLIAAARAIESEREDALFVDPFAALLAGPKALKRCRARLRKQQLKPRTTPRSVGNITCRTKFLDDAIHFFAGSGVAAARMAEYLLQIKNSSAAISSKPALRPHAQVVLVGAGMDTRAHRLDLPDSVRWIEVDRTEVLRVKQKILSNVKRKLLQSKSVAVYSAGGELGSAPLQQLVEDAGFDRKVPTLWVLEGLTMYLTPDQNCTLLKEMASLSSSGSMFLMSVVPARCIGGATNPKSLMSTWKWGFPDSFVQDTKALGWDVVDSIDYASVAHLYDCRYWRQTGSMVTGASQLDQPDRPATKSQPSASMVPDCTQVVIAVVQQ
eukprot:jgi/Ulvmu1/7504/UM037_0048.1